ncbi:hypothetical protein HAL1_15721 [Halomonas sp. HAL1]|uniref:hypothetical protein n=1 Tax=Halomonas sp. HAL1 TaxID=550984 RepID=UPI00022D2D19|nr:hypothetical protein [Halomonas sp. HAL1]EHA14571.1 hypothetical protein HAL1_15721 [Halomonas sp. HAL1]
MTLAASTYLEHLKAYINSEYVVHDGAEGKIILTEKYFRPEDTKPQVRNIELLLPGEGIAFKLDKDDFETDKKRKRKESLKNQASHLFFTFSMIRPNSGQNAAISSFFM